MAVDDRTDPAQIIARVGNFANRERALEVWMYLATQAGWQVSLVPDMPLDVDARDCGIVEVEGLRYRIRHTPRVRTILVDDTGGRVVHRPVFDHAAWAEPVLEPDGFVPYLGS
ncbi:hypothetical protein H1V43_08030 [Streptomyces sp. PSKA54]|uniref:Uncharacterized protein n=1 Tax=Streptomyces himalayensis subsp. aureolus TaxID=2758039 RepID=A0A7W2CYN3_9ACTN|nr:hypothetical protein [Streptomyces himalayensis]MBA4861337.1 hypothetical protein [Streptomyces himalayensis subsp. aureolus]